MKKISITIFAVVLSLGVFAQQIDTMFIHKEDTILAIPTNTVDSIGFYQMPPNDTMMHIYKGQSVLKISIWDIDFISFNRIQEHPLLPLISSCNAFEPHWGASLGTVSFYSDKEWIIEGNNMIQIWSDAVSATACNKDDFRGAESLGRGPRPRYIRLYNFNADCRNSPDFPGDLFSWCAVYRFADVLCPYPWRVPTKQDFVELDIIFGRTSRGRRHIELIIDDYINRWGGVFSASAGETEGALHNFPWGWYWSQTGTHPCSRQGSFVGTSAHVLFFGSRFVFPESSTHKGAGLTVRCVRDSTAEVPRERIAVDRNRCNRETPGWGDDLGVVSFHTNREWTIEGNGITQTWSDAVTATACNKTVFDGGWGRYTYFNADCRSNPGFPGDLFSWCAVARFADVLCPYPWRVPTRQDFIALDIALGGNGRERVSDSFGTIGSRREFRRVNRDARFLGGARFSHITTSEFIADNYIERWGGAFGGQSNSHGRLGAQGGQGLYWSKSESVRVPASNGHMLRFTSRGSANPQSGHYKAIGNALRCVR